MIEASPSRCTPEQWTAEQAARAMGVVDEADGEALEVEAAASGEIGMAGAVGREEPSARGGMRWVAGGAALGVVAAAAWWSGAGNGNSREILVHAGADGALIAGERTPNSGPGDFNSSNGSSHMKIQTVISSAMLCSVVGVTAGLVNSASGEGVVRCWGWNNLGQCDVPPDLGVVRQISAGGYFTLAVRQDGTVRCWGQNDDGQCNVPADLGAVRQVVAGGYHVIALRQDNTVRCWGRNDYGQINVPSDLQAVMQVAGGGFITTVVEYNGTARCWGRNDDGQCNVPADLGTVVQMTAGRGHTFARRTDGSLRGWGRNDYGQCNVPADVTNAIQVAATGDHTVALQPDGSVRCWGTGSVDTGSNSNYGQSIVPPDLGLVDQVAAEGYSTMALRHDGTVRCWGYNKYGECNVPTDLVDVVQIAGGGHHNVAISAIDQAIQWRVADGGNGHWYERMLDASSWSSSKEKCAQVGGHLATITSATENDFIHGVVGANQAWIGGTQTPGSCEPGCGWYWITGEPWTYSNWSPGEPNNDLGQDFLNLYASGAWDDFYDPRPFQFVCEWSADCNSDSIVDYGQILNGTLADTNTNGVPDICEGRLTIRVPADQPTIQAAIDAAPLNAQCIVAVSAGTYAGPIDFKGKSVIVRGAGASQTVISGSAGSTLSVVRFTGGEPAFAALENVSIRGGVTGSPFPGSPQFQVGGGLFAYNSAASVRDCVFENNTAAFGGGAYVWNCTGSIERCTFRNNRAGADGAGIQLTRGNNTVVDTIVENNTANSRGGGMHIVDGTPHLVRTVVRNNISSNIVGGVSWVPAGNAAAFLSIDGCNVTGNTAAVVQGGIGVLEDGATTKVSLHGTSVCGNLPRPNVAGRFNDLGGNVICDCTGDLNLDGVVNGADLGLMLSSWGPCGSSCPYDLNVDGVVNGADLGLMLSAWGTCGN